MAEENSIPPVPYKTPMLNASGFLTGPWSVWFRQIFNRVGGNIALSNADIEEQLTNHETDIQELQALVDGILQEPVA